MLCFFFLRNLQASVRTRRILLLNTKTVQESLLIVSFDKTAKPLCKVHSYVGFLLISIWWMKNWVFLFLRLLFSKTAKVVVFL